MSRVGGTEEVSVNVRVIAATNRPLKELVEKGEFREDLYYRLNVVPITIPPLRDRKEDILPAAEYFVEKYTKLYDKNFELSQDYNMFLLRERWEGNLRELENCIERLVVTEGSLPFSEKKEDDGQGKVDNRSQMEKKHEMEHHQRKTMKDIEKEMIIEMWNKYQSSYKVAEALGISQSTAHRKIRKYVKDKG